MATTATLKQNNIQMAAKSKSSNRTHHNNLHDAIKHADVKELQRLIQQGCPINGVDAKFKFAPIHWAVHYGSIECLHWLLWHGADYHIQSAEGWTPAHIAAIRGRDLCLQSLCANGADMNILDSRGKTPAHLACSHGNTKSLQEVLRKGVDHDIRDSMGWAQTHTAAFHGRLGCLQILKKWGFNMKSLDNNGNSLAHLAAGEGHVLCLKFLVSITPKAESLVKARNDQGETPKDTAVQYFKKKCVEYLSAIEYDVEHPESSENLAYPAHNSAYNGDLEFLEMAIETGVASLNDRDERGSTPAHKAAGNGQLEVLRWLLERGANMSILNSAGETPRDVALRFGRLDCAKLIGGDEADFVLDEDGEYDVNPDGPQSQIEAQARAHRKVDELLEQLEIAKLNFQHLGGVLPEDRQKLQQQQEHARANRELEEQLEYERVKREKLESRLDTMRLEIQNVNRELEDTRKLVIPKPPTADRRSVLSNNIDPMVKESPVIPKCKKGKKRTPKRPKSGVFLVQRTPGVYEPLTVSTRGGVERSNRSKESAAAVSSEKRDASSSASNRPKTALASYKSPFDEKTVRGGGRGANEEDVSVSQRSGSDRSVRSNRTEENDNSSLILSPRDDESQKSNASHRRSDHGSRSHSDVEASDDEGQKSLNNSSASSKSSKSYKQSDSD